MGPWACPTVRRPHQEMRSSSSPARGLSPPFPVSHLAKLIFWHTFLGYERALSRPRPQLTLDSLSTPQPRSAKKGVGRRAGREPSRESYFCAADKWRSRQIFLAPAPSLRLSVLLSSPFYTVCLLSRSAAASRNVLYDAD